MITDDEVRSGWLMILGREPKSPAVYEELRKLPDLAALRTVLMESAEFRQRYPTGSKHVARHVLGRNAAPPTVVPEKTLESMFARIQQQWAKLGETEPYWSVLTSEKYKSSHIEENKDKFFETGAMNLDVLSAALARCGVSVPDGGECLELGCGVGRVSVHLARRFRKVYALDVSPGNLATAKKNAEVYGNDNINFKLITKIRDYERVPSFDFFFSLIVLQHNPPPVQRYMLERIAAKAKPGALFYFQVQAYAEKYDFDPNTYLDSPDHQMEMHVFPQSAVFDVLRTARCKILDVMEDNPTNHPNWMSMAFLAQKAPR